MKQFLNLTGMDPESLVLWSVILSCWLGFVNPCTSGECRNGGMAFYVKAGHLGVMTSKH